MVRIRHGRTRFGRCVMRGPLVSGHRDRLPSGPLGVPLQTCAPPSARHLVDPDGLAALRLAVAVARDPMAGLTHERVAYRSLARQRSATATVGVPPQQPGAPAIESTGETTTEPRTAPRIPLPSPPAEPVGEQATVMALVTAAQAGDGEAFGQLYDTYVDVVHRYIAYRVNNHALAEDLTSETFLKALRRISSYTWQGRDFGAWLVTIARNLIADHFKSSRYKLELSTADLVESGAERSSDSPENEVLTGITNATLLDAVKRLGAEQQECIVLRFLQGMSVAETAAVLGKNENAVKALQYRAVKALGRILPAELVA
jgi:RNA polymerase sigma-70 factor (ECF subfamily)